jgi:tellurite resistance protein TerC
MQFLLDLSAETWLMIGFGLLILIFLILDLGILHKHAEKISTRSALLQTLFWVSISLSFAFLIWKFDGGTPAERSKNAVDYLTAYLMEWALSVDNLFIILLILRYFKIAENLYHKVLFWGIMGALVMRGTFITVAWQLIEHFHFILYVFGGFLVFTGFKMLNSSGQEEFNPNDNWIVKFARKNFRLTDEFNGENFTLKKAGKLYFTPLFLVILLIESTDLIFALDSIPAVFAISQNPFIVYTSNIFAVMGLRALFFLLADIMDRFHYLQRALSFILMFIGIKMLLAISGEPWFMELTGMELGIHIPAWVSLLVILTVLSGAILFSLYGPPPEEEDMPDREE